MDGINAANIASVALLSSFSHCVGMCGGFMALQSLFLRDRSGTARVAAVFSYHFMRVLAYVLIGALAGAFGGIFVISLKSRAMIFFVIGLVLVAIGVALWVRGGMLNFIENRQISRAVTLAASNLASKKSALNFALLGFLNGLLPCGVVYYFAALAIASGSAVKGAEIMTLFGLCSLPSLIGFGLFFEMVGAKFRQIMFKISLIIIILNGIYLTFLGYTANG